MGEDGQAEAETKRARRPSEGAAHTMEDINGGEGAAPSAEAQHEQPKPAGGNGMHAHWTNPPPFVPPPLRFPGARPGAFPRCPQAWATPIQDRPRSRLGTP